MRAPKNVTKSPASAPSSSNASLDRTAEKASEEADASTMAAVGEEAPAVEEKGESGRTNRDMQTVTDHYDERPIIDIRKIERAIDKLVQIREADLQAREKPFVPRISLKGEAVKQFMDKTGEARLVAEKYLDAAGGDLKTALIKWIETPFGVHFPNLYPKPASLADLLSERREGV